MGAGPEAPRRVVGDCTCVLLPGRVSFAFTVQLREHKHGVCLRACWECRALSHKLNCSILTTLACPVSSLCRSRPQAVRAFPHDAMVPFCPALCVEADNRLPQF